METTDTMIRRRINFMCYKKLSGQERMLRNLILQGLSFGTLVRQNLEIE